jgi:Asp-tRNA(Asn)/Glu-tRNA(Gln) amidotransferase A subunit family amidase
VPTLSLPGWKVDGLPIGLQLAGRFGDDESLLTWALDIAEALDS